MCIILLVSTVQFEGQRPSFDLKPLPEMSSTSKDKFILFLSTVQFESHCVHSYLYGQFRGIDPKNYRQR